MAWSTQQEAIFEWFSGGAKPLFQNGVGRLSKHLVVRARAGCGKTTTIIEGIKHAPENKILLCAFNKRIADELNVRLSNPRAQAKTLHAVGFAAVRRYWSNVRICDRNERADDLTEQVCGPRVPDAVKKLVSKLHTKGREIVPHCTSVDELVDIGITFECEPDEQWQWCETCGRTRDRHGDDHPYRGFDLITVAEYAVQAMDLAGKVKPVKTGIDFSDMIFLPVRNHWLSKTYDLVVVDEAQDMTAAQLEIALGVCRGRICVVGDDRQAIYGFRGADSGSLDRLKRTLQASELGLTTTYRCGRVIVEEAARLVPDFMAGPDNPQGSINLLPLEKLADTAEHGDFILSRINAPLVTIALSLLRRNKRARVAGRDIGAGLTRIVRKLATGKAADSIPALLERIEAWREREINRMLRAKREDRVELINDQASMLSEMAAESSSVRDMIQRIEVLFTDDGLGQAGIITCSSIHRAKGLESDRVLVLRDTLHSFSNRGESRTQEEINLQYVAITRAKNTLVYVTGKTSEE